MKYIVISPLALFFTISAHAMAPYDAKIRTLNQDAQKIIAHNAQMIAKSRLTNDLKLEKIKALNQDAQEIIAQSALIIARS